MYRTLKRKGYLRGISTFRPYVARLKKVVPHEININRRIIQKILWEDESSNKPLLIKILDTHPFLKVLNELVRSFKNLFTEVTSEQDILWWCEQAERMNEAPLSSFATYIRGDIDAIRIGMTLPWSNGMVEGHQDDQTPNVWSGRIGAVAHQDIECHLRLVILLKYESRST